MEKPFYFLFAFLVLLISFTRSETEVNSQLVIDFNCSTSNDPCDSKNAFCNSAGKCQCLFGYSPNGANCEQFRCGHPNVQPCSTFYNDSNARCNDGKCECLATFSLNARTQKCELNQLNTRRLGGRCVADHQCGDGTGCTTMGECRCHAGSLPETEFTCSKPHCSSTEFCHTNITANTVCIDNNCHCQRPYFDEDSDTFECVRVLPDTVPLGAHCANSTYCGEGAKCTAGKVQICKCQLGYGPTSDFVCEFIRCVKDEYCHRVVSPLTFCNDGSCECRKGFYQNPYTLECSPEAPNIGEPCAQQNDMVYQQTCGDYAECNKDRKCACWEGYKARRDLPFLCEWKDQPN